ncbi:hypothetical protein IWW38_002555, partial [Coemansia aciculifera]
MGDAEVVVDDTQAMLAELQQKLAKYDQLELEISKLTQEQATLESYVTNLMASNVFTYRTHKPVNYCVEQAFDASDSDSDFEKPSTSVKLSGKKRGRPPAKALGNAEAKAAQAPPAKKKARQVYSSDEDDEDGDSGDGEPQRREGTAETEQVMSSPPIAAAASRGSERAVREVEVVVSSPPSAGQKTSGKRGAKAVRDDSSSEDDFGGDGGSESESDFGGDMDSDDEDKPAKGKGKKAVAAAKPKPKQTTAPRGAKKAVEKKAPAAPAKKTSISLVKKIPVSPVKKA